MQRIERREHRGVVEDAAFERGRVHLVEIEVTAKQGPAFLHLPLEGRQRMILDLMHPGIESPVAHVGVPPL